MKRTKQIIKSLTPSSVQLFLIRLGLFFSRNMYPFPSHEATLETLKSLGWRPRRCIDVGAYQGEWTKMFHSCFPEAEVLMIEAQQAKENYLKEVVARAPDRFAYELALLGANDGLEVEFVEMETGSSVFEESSPGSRTKKIAKLTRLDTLLTRYMEFREADILKLDTQGYELEIMRGAECLLEAVGVVLLEVSLLPINRGAPVFSEVVGFMTARGFRLFDFCGQGRRKDGVLWQVDLLFIREGVLPNVKPELVDDNW